MATLCAFGTHRYVIVFAEHRQRLVVLSAQVAAGEGGRVRQPVFVQRWIPLVRREVDITVRRLAHQARLHRRRLVSMADITGNDSSLG